MESTCIYCSKLFDYNPSQSNGKYCSNRCQSDLTLSKRFQNGTRWNYAMSKFVKRLKGDKCEECGICEWNGKKLTMQVDHIDGDRKNNEISNLKVLCPNCHSQTETYGSKNVSPEGKTKMIESINKNRQGPIAQ
jgi:Zn finger protein HypA/HybF involved in hydrogenase expression